MIYKKKLADIISDTKHIRKHISAYQQLTAIQEINAG